MDAPALWIESRYREAEQVTGTVLCMGPVDNYRIRSWYCSSRGIDAKVIA